VDVPELLRVLDFRSGSAEIIEPSSSAAGVRRYVTGAPEFELFVLQVNGEGELSEEVSGPEILFVTQGQVRVSRAGAGLFLDQGESAFIRPGAQYSLSGNGATVYRASVP
jgi:mannose-6-phosphate isomerase